MGFNRTFSSRLEDLSTNNVIYADDVSVIPFDGSAWRPINATYILTDTIDFGIYPVILPVNGQVQFRSANRNANQILTSVPNGTALFQGTEVDRFQLSEVDVVSQVGGDLFDLKGSAVANTAVEFFQSTATAFTNIGVIDTFNLLTVRNINFTSCSGPLSCNDVNFYFFFSVGFNAQDGDGVVIAGSTLLGSFQGIAGAPTAGESLFNIDSAISITNVLSFFQCSFINLGGDFFDPAGLDERNPNILVQIIPGLTDSQLTRSRLDVSSTTNLDPNVFYDVILADTSGGQFSINLFSAAGFEGKRVSIKKQRGGAPRLTLNPDGADTIDGLSSLILRGALGPSVTLESIGTGWIVL